MPLTHPCRQILSARIRLCEPLRQTLLNSDAAYSHGAFVGGRCSKYSELMARAVARSGFSHTFAKAYRPSSRKSDLLCLKHIRSVGKRMQTATAGPLIGQTLCMTRQAGCSTKYILSGLHSHGVVIEKITSLCFCSPYAVFTGHSGQACFSFLCGTWDAPGLDPDWSEMKIRSNQVQLDLVWSIRIHLDPDRSESQIQS